MLLGWERDMHSESQTNRGAGNHPVKKWGESDSK